MSKSWLTVAALAACVPAIGLAEPVRVILASGEAWIGQGEQRVPARLGVELAADLAATGEGGALQIRLADGAIVVLPGASELRLAADPQGAMTLVRGGVRIGTAFGKPRRVVQADGRRITVGAYLKLQTCDQACGLRPGVYGRASGETVVDFEGGRSVLKDKPFRLPAGGTRPEVLVKAPALLDDRPNFQQADEALKQAAAELAEGEEAFKANDFETARSHFEAAQAIAPSEPMVDYYLGLIALNRQDNAEALRQLQRYVRDDRQAAVARDVPRLITLLSTRELQDEVATALAQEKSLSAAPPEPDSVAVQAFASHGDPEYRAMAKGIAAMVIADLSKVPGLKVLERERVQQIIDELKLDESGLVDPATAGRTGRLMRAERVIVGSFGVE
ncbi:MAG: hypothetical protein JOY60_13120 [Burkholderiaceae bacterium]|nr:hypothetical protein [Burkholderiaceae bacterium]